MDRLGMSISRLGKNVPGALLGRAELLSGVT